MHRRVNWCFNRPPYRDAILVQDGWEWYQVAGGSWQRRPVTTFIQFENSRDCQYTLSSIGQADPKCAGCNWRRSPT